MNRLTRFYSYGILGAIGGLIGWQVSNILGLSFTDNFFLSEVIIGAVLGGMIGLMIGFGEGIATQNFLYGLKKSLLSALLGAIGGAIALPIAEGVFLFIGGQAWSRPIGWAIFGLLTGLATGITGGAQLWKGGLGGLIGGALGGALLETVRSMFADPLMGKAAGLMLLGLSVGVFIALIVFLLSRVWLEVTNGKMRGMEFILDKFLSKQAPSATIGSSPLKSDIVIADSDIAPQHAILKGEGTYFTLKDISMAGTFINGKKIEVTRLHPNQRIRMGKSELVYHEKR
ncbi:MAG: FHA domain-containing protein [Anaerolineaceae bacterium]|nr:FHA domain-containing protein [Anaerolineaceae bacterium]